MGHNKTANKQEETERLLHQGLQRGHGSPTPGPWTSAFQNWEAVDAFWFGPPVCRESQQPQEMNTSCVEVLEARTRSTDHRMVRNRGRCLARSREG